MGEEPLHWSERAKLASSGFPPVFGLHQPPPPRSRKKFLLAGAIVVLVVAIAVAVVALLPFGDRAAKVPTASSLSASSTTPSPPATATAAGSARPASSTTTTAETAGLVAYASAEGGFIVKHPASWKKTSVTKLGDGETDPYFVVGFADQSTPGKDGQFLNFLAVDVWADTPFYESMLPAFQEAMRQALEETRNTYDDVELIEPIRSVWVGGAPGYTMTYSLSWQGQKAIVSDYVLIANRRGYGLEVSARGTDFEACAPLFKKIIEDFELTPSQVEI